MTDAPSPGVSQKRPTTIERRTTFWGVAGLIALLFAVTNLPWHLDDYDQAKQAFTSFEMVHEGHWLYQHTPNEKIATKPPLVGLISAACYALTRSWEMAWRLPSLAAAIGLLVVLTRTATATYGGLAGLLAMSALGLNLLSPRLATLVRTDMPLALVVFLLGLKVWHKVRTCSRPALSGRGHAVEADAPEERRQSAVATAAWQTRDRLAMFALLTAAMLIKGPIVYAFLLPGIVLFQLRKRDENVSAWCGWWPWLASLAIFLAWVGGGIAWVPGFYEQVVLREFAGRFSETVHRPQPIYFYWPHLLHKFSPWSILLLGFAALGWRMQRVTLREAWRRLSPDVAWLVCWAMGSLLLMSLIPSKRVDRIFPIVPPLCLLVAVLCAWFLTRNDWAGRGRRWGAIALIFACVFSSGYAAQRIVIGYRANEAALAHFGTAVRKEAAANGWRYEVMGGKEEGLLLYLRRTRFIKAEEAINRWKAGTLEAVVAPAEEVPRLRIELPGSAPSGLEASVTINDRLRRYVLLQREAL